MTDIAELVMHAARGVIGTFGGPAEAAGAVRVLLERGFADVHAEISGAPGPAQHPVRRAGLSAIGTLRAAIAGMVGGVLVAGLVSLDAIPSGRGLLTSLPPGAEVALVSLVLFVSFGSLVNFVAVVTGCWARPDGEAAARPEESGPVAVLACGGDRDLAARILSEAGARSVAVERGRLLRRARGGV